MPQNIYDVPDFYEGYKNMREAGSGLNDCLEQPAFRKMVPDLTGKDILDLGCGMGHLANWCADGGAKSIVAADISENMLSEARIRHARPNIEYMQMSMEKVHFPAGSFDMVVSSLAMHYVEDYQGLVAKIFNWLRPGGWLVASMEHPIVTAHTSGHGWFYDDNGVRLHYPIDHYQQEGLRQTHWYVDDVERFHRTISTLMNGLIEAGFTIDRVEEPEPIPEALITRPDLLHESRRPSFLLIRARKS